jgi:hypothetical protein
MKTSLKNQNSTGETSEKSIPSESASGVEYPIMNISEIGMDKNYYLGDDHGE